MPAKVTHQVKPQLMHRYLCSIDRRSLNEWRKFLFQSAQQILLQLQNLLFPQNFHSSHLRLNASTFVTVPNSTVSTLPTCSSHNSHSHTRSHRYRSYFEHL